MLCDPMRSSFEMSIKDNVVFKIPILATFPLLVTAGLIILLFFFYSPLLSLSYLMVN